MPDYLERGSRGDDVEQLQASLNRLMSPVPLLKVDGIFGAKTVATAGPSIRDRMSSLTGVVWQSASSLERHLHRIFTTT